MISSLASLVERLRIIIARMYGTGTAALNLREDLEKYVRPVFLDKIKVDALFHPMKSYILSNSMEDPDQVMDHLVDRYIDEGGSARLLGRLIDTIKGKEHYDDQEAQRVLHRGPLTDDQEKKVELIKDEYGKMIYSYLSRLFMNFTKQYFTSGKRKMEKHEEFQRGIGDITEQEHEIEEEAKKEYSWESGLIDDTLAYLKSRVPDERLQALYKAILLERIIPEVGEKRTLKQLEDKLDISNSTLSRGQEVLEKLVKEFYRSRPDLQKFLGPGIFKEEVEVPNYKEFLKKEEDQRDLYEWIEGKFRADKQSPAEETLSILRGLSEGETVQELAEGLKKPTQTVTNIKTRHFNPAYEGWYRDKVKQIRKAYSMLIFGAKDDTESDVAYDLLDDIKKKKRHVSVKVYFHADFHGGHKLFLEGQDPQFGWDKYEVVIDHDYKGHNLKYKFSKDLKGSVVSDKNILESEPYQETYEIDGKNFAKDNYGFQQLHQWLKENVFKEGLMPKGPFPVHYYNTNEMEAQKEIDELNARMKTEKSIKVKMDLEGKIEKLRDIIEEPAYNGTPEFLKMMHRVYTKDLPHQEWEGKRKKFMDLKRYGPLKRTPGFEEDMKELKGLEVEYHNTQDPELLKKIEVLREKIDKKVEKSQGNEDYYIKQLQDRRKTRKPEEHIERKRVSELNFF